MAAVRGLVLNHEGRIVAIRLAWIPSSGIIALHSH